MNEIRLDKFLDRLRGISFVTRWNFHPTTTKENVAEHSAWVTIYAMLFALIDDLSPASLFGIITSALVHDFEESLTGDLPMLVKREVKESWRSVEHVAMDQLCKFLPGSVSHTIKEFKFEDNAHILKYVKAADVFDVVMYCRTERKLGNMTMRDIELEAVTALRRTKLESVDQILDSYGYPKHEHSAVELPADMTHL